MQPALAAPYTMTHPGSVHGKICYLEIPTANVAQSAEFYRSTFGWQIRERGDGTTAFDDATGQVSGAWILGRPVMKDSDSGILISIMVEDAAATLQSILANGGSIVEPVGSRAPEITALFSDPSGNVMQLYQEPA